MNHFSYGYIQILKVNMLTVKTHAEQHICIFNVPLHGLICSIKLKN